MINPFEVIKNISGFGNKDEEARENVDQAPEDKAQEFENANEVQKEGVYKMTLKVNGTTFERSGNDASIFEGIDIRKVSTKAVVNLEKNGKSHEFIMTPMVLKRIVVNKTAREIQFKKLSMFVD